MLRAVAVLAALLVAPLAFAGTASVSDPAGDVTFSPELSGMGGGAPLIGGGACDNPRVDFVSFTTVADAQHVAYTLGFAGAAGPSCSGQALTGGTRGTSISLGWWYDDAMLRVLDSSSSGNCIAFGEFQTAESFEQFWTPCSRSETPTSVTYTLDTFGEVASTEAPPIDLRTLNYGAGSAFASESGALAGGVGLRFRDTVSVPAGPLP